MGNYKKNGVQSRIGCVMFSLLAGSVLFGHGKENLSGIGPSESGAKQVKPNRLIHEKSPYLLQHAYNPVDWYPWGQEAFDAAKKRNVPIFLSIGYSTCHWCHVMEHESFEDSEVAKLMNETFVSIKVDREERPDIDNVYMTAAMTMNGGGGWPLTIIMTPDKKPFFSGTYFPKESRFGRVGLKELIPRIHETWQSQRKEIESSADQIREALQRNTGEVPGKDLNVATLTLGFEQLAQSFDSKQGGFGAAPKFPTPHNLLFLLRYWNRTGNAKALEMAEKTLTAMRLGGIYDQVGYGFHRYSTDERWLQPHFEKMIYDQALLMMAYGEAYEATHKDAYAQTARETATYVLRDMTDIGGGFYSAEDADSEGKEGKFYLWSEKEIRDVLSMPDAEWAIRMFHLSREGNFHGDVGEGKNRLNILHMEKPLDQFQSASTPVPSSTNKRWAEIRSRLFATREKRIHPRKDDKVLADWNGLMIAALAKTGRALGDPGYIQAARRAADFVLLRMRTPDGRLLHRFRDGQSALAAHVDDYAFMVWGLLELYESSFEVKYLLAAKELTEIQIRHFWDEKNAGFFFTADDGEKLLIRQKEIYDGAIPSGNSVSMLNLLRLSRMTGKVEWEEMASHLAKAFSGSVTQAPSAYALFLSALDFAIGPSFEVVIAGNPQAEDTRKMLETLRKNFNPREVVLLRSSQEEKPSIIQAAPFTEIQKPLKDRATAYVCQNHVCNFPTTDPATMLALLRKK